MPAFWAMIETTCYPGTETEVRGEVMRKIGHYRGTGAVPVLIASSKNSGKLNIGCVFTEFKELTSFATEYVRVGGGVAETFTYLPLAFKPIVQGASLAQTLAKTAAQKGSTLGIVYLNTSPGDDSAVFWQFSMFRESGGVQPLWGGIALHSPDVDVILALAGPSQEAVAAYVQQQFEDMEGVLGHRMECYSDLQLLRSEREITPALEAVGSY